MSEIPIGGLMAVSPKILISPRFDSFSLVFMVLHGIQSHLLARVFLMHPSDYASAG